MTFNPPALAERVLALSVPDEAWRDSILGDLREEFRVMLDTRGKGPARRWYWRQALAIGDLKGAGQALLFEVGPGQVDGGGRQVHTGDLGAAPGKPREVHAGAAADFENRSAPIAVKRHEPQQMVELLEMILVEIVEEAAGSDRMRRDLQIVNMPVPVQAHGVGRSHGQTITAAKALRCR